MNKQMVVNMEEIAACSTTSTHILKQQVEINLPSRA
jgi:hypothetical protein